MIVVDYGYQLVVRKRIDDMEWQMNFDYWLMMQVMICVVCVEVDLNDLCLLDEMINKLALVLIWLTCSHSHRSIQVDVENNDTESM